MSQERAFDICLEMLQQRNYNIIETEKDNLRIIAIKPDGQQMCVIFNLSPKFDTKSMKEIITIMNELEVIHSLVIYQDSITPATKSTLSQTSDIIIELFAQEDLQYNITKHYLQPKFECLTDEQAEIFKKKYGTKFPVLRADRPISRFYNYQKGNVIRITRNNGYISYRIVKG